VDSVLEIRRFITGAIGDLQADSKLAQHLRAIRAACRQFLDGLGPEARRRDRPWAYGSEFFTAVGELRANIGTHIAAIAVMHGIDLEGDLARSLPPAVTDADGGV
jgi:hypothetical protein